MTATQTKARRFSRTLARTPFFIDPEEGVPATPEGYVLLELVGKARDSYVQGLSSRYRIGPDGKPAGIQRFDGLQGDLVSRALHKADLQIHNAGRDDEYVEIVRVEEATVPMATIQEFPASQLQWMFEESQRLSGLSGEAEAEAKND